jgi:hypothetical protein
VDYNGNALTYNGSSWSSPDQIDPGLADLDEIDGWLSSVSCPTASFCTAVDSVGYGFTYDGKSWSSPDEVDSGVIEANDMNTLAYGTAVPGQLQAVSCASGNFCAAVDTYGDVMTYNGALWSSPAGIDQNGLNSVSCPTASFCVALDGSGRALTYNGSSWSKPISVDPKGGGLGSVSCPSASFCVALDGSGKALTYNGSSWSKPVSVDANKGGLGLVSCPSARFCAALDGNGYAFTYSPPAASKTILKLSVAKVAYGHEQVEHLSVTVSPQDSRTTPTGKVTIKASTTMLSVIKLKAGKGSCSLSARRLKAGTYSLVATYGGSANFKGSTSAKETLIVAK